MAVGADSGQIGSHGIDDDESAIGNFVDGLFEPLEIAGEGEESTRPSAVDGQGEAAEDADASEICAGGFEARLNRVLETVVGTEEEDARGFAEHGIGRDVEAAGDAGGEVEAEEGLSGVGLADEQGNLSEGKSVVPEPVNRPLAAVGDADEPGLGRLGLWSRLFARFVVHGWSAVSEKVVLSL
jgi:hypothetical protein